MVKMKVYILWKMVWKSLVARAWLCGHRIHRKVSGLNLLQFGNAFEHLALQLKSDISQLILSYEVLLHVMGVFLSSIIQLHRNLRCWTWTQRNSKLFKECIMWICTSCTLDICASTYSFFPWKTPPWIYIYIFVEIIKRSWGVFFFPVLYEMKPYWL